MTEAEIALYTAVYAAVLGSDPQRDHDRADDEARKAVERFRRANAK